jgi:hypothetical protein
VDPQVVGVVVAPARVIAERRLLAGRRLGGLAQHEPPTVTPPRDVAALAVGLGADDDLHRERRALGREPAQQPWVEDRAEVVRVRRERVLVAALEQRREHPGAAQRRVEVAVAGRAPLERGVGRPAHRPQVVGADAGLAVLEKVGRDVGA